jgi:hypothetical protein
VCKLLSVCCLQGQSSLESHESTVEVFGRWQTEEYMPPLVVDVSSQGRGGGRRLRKKGGGVGSRGEL